MKTRTTEEDRRNSELSIQMLLPPRSRSTQFVLDLIQDFNEQARLLDSLRRIQIAIQQNCESSRPTFIRFRMSDGQKHRVIPVELEFRAIFDQFGGRTLTSSGEQWQLQASTTPDGSGDWYPVADILEWLEDTTDA